MDDEQTEGVPRKWNPRFVAYCTAHGRQPEKLMELDAEWPGGRCVGFILWLSKAYDVWTTELGVRGGNGFTARDNALSKYGHASFDAWLNAYALKEAACLSAPSNSQST